VKIVFYYSLSDYIGPPKESVYKILPEGGGRCGEKTAPIGL
jgi:hypothetical protein